MSFEVTISGNVDDLDLNTIEAWFEQRLCAGVAACTVTIKVQGGSTVLVVRATAPAAEAERASVAENTIALVAATQSSVAEGQSISVGGRPIEALTVPLVTTTAVEVSVAPPPPSPPPDSPGGTSVAIIAGAAAAGGAVVVLLLGAAFWWWRCRQGMANVSVGSTAGAQAVSAGGLKGGGLV